jgi:hypothetical protein
MIINHNLIKNNFRQIYSSPFPFYFVSISFLLLLPSSLIARATAPTKRSSAGLKLQRLRLLLFVGAVALASLKPPNLIRGTV